MLSGATAQRPLSETIGKLVIDLQRSVEIYITAPEGSTVVRLVTSEAMVLWRTHNRGVFVIAVAYVLDFHPQSLRRCRLHICSFCLLFIPLV